MCARRWLEAEVVWDELPERWELASLGDIAQDIQTGFACSARDEEGLPHLRPNNVGTDGKLNLNLVKRVPFEAGDLSRYDLKPGDVLFNNTNSQELVGKTAIFDLEGTYSFSNHLTRIRVRPGLLIPEWLSFWFQHLWRTHYFERICNRWIGQAGINTEKLSGVEVPIPPLDEQRRIVARIEELWLDKVLLRMGFAQAACELLPRLALKEFFRPAQVDPHGNFNNVVIGTDYHHPRFRLPGCGGIGDVTTTSDKVYLYVPRHSRAVMVEQVDFVSGLGHSPARRAGAGPRYLVSNLGQFDFFSGRMRVTTIHPGVTLEKIQGRTGFPLEIAPDLHQTEPPTPEEVQLLREVIDPLGIRRLETVSGSQRKRIIHEILDTEQNEKPSRFLPQQAEGTQGGIKHGYGP